MIDKDNPNTWRHLFDGVIRRLEQGLLPEHVGLFDMHCITEYDPSCGMVACLFGSAALAAGNYSLDGPHIFNLYVDWTPNSNFMWGLKRLCAELEFTTEQVIDAYYTLADTNEYWRDDEDDE